MTELVGEQSIMREWNTETLKCFTEEIEYHTKGLEFSKRQKAEAIASSRDTVDIIDGFIRHDEIMIKIYTEAKESWQRSDEELEQLQKKWEQLPKESREQLKEEREQLRKRMSKEEQEQ